MENTNAHYDVKVQFSNCGLLNTHTQILLLKKSTERVRQLIINTEQECIS